MVRRFDAGELSKPVKLDNGWLRLDGTLTRVGVFDYRQHDGSVRRELRLPDEVFHEDALTSFELVPVTIDHPPEILDSKNTSRFQKGTVSKIRRDGANLVGTILLTDQSAVDQALKGGRKQLSCGYHCDLDETPGVTSGIPGVADGTRYDAIQRNVRGNHLALVHRARAGEVAQLKLDAADAQMVHSDAEQERDEKGRFAGNGGGGDGPKAGTLEHYTQAADKAEAADKAAGDRGNTAEAHEAAAEAHLAAADSADAFSKTNPDATESADNHENAHYDHKAQAASLRAENAKATPEDHQKAAAAHQAAADSYSGGGFNNDQMHAHEAAAKAHGLAAKGDHEAASKAFEKAGKMMKEIPSMGDHARVLSMGHGAIQRGLAAKNKRNDWPDKDGNDDHGRGEGGNWSANNASTKADVATRKAESEKATAQDHENAAATHETAAKEHESTGNKSAAELHRTIAEAHTHAAHGALGQGAGHREAAGKASASFLKASRMVEKSDPDHAELLESHAAIQQKLDDRRNDSLTQEKRMKTIKLDGIDHEVNDLTAQAIELALKKSSDAVAKEKARADAAEEKLAAIDVQGLATARLVLIRSAEKLLPPKHGLKLDELGDDEIRAAVVKAKFPKASTEKLKDPVYLAARFDALVDEEAAQPDVNEGLMRLRGNGQRQDGKDEGGSLSSIDDARKRMIKDNGSAWENKKAE